MIDIDLIRKEPTVFQNIHESIFRSYAILEVVKMMLKRGDSKETILDILHAIEKNI